MERLERRLVTKVARACSDHRLLEADDRVMVAMSGGKDSYCMLHLLQEVRRRAPFDFELIAVHLDQHQPDFDGAPLRRWLAERGVAYRILSEDTYSVVVANTPAGKAYCSMCSRLRRGILYAAAVEMGCTKIALGHHRDDSIETLMLNLFYAGQIKAMPPRLRSDDGRNTVIRPLIYVAEAETRALAEALGFPVQPCAVCSRQPDLKRAKVKALLDALDAENPKVRSNVFAALGNVQPSHLLDARLRAQLGSDEPREDDETLVALGSVPSVGGCGVA